VLKGGKKKMDEQGEQSSSSDRRHRRRRRRRKRAHTPSRTFSPSSSLFLVPLSLVSLPCRRSRSCRREVRLRLCAPVQASSLNFVAKEERSGRREKLSSFSLYSAIGFALARSRAQSIFLPSRPQFQTASDPLDPAAIYTIVGSGSSEGIGEAPATTTSYGADDDDASRPPRPAATTDADPPRRPPPPPLLPTASPRPPPPPPTFKWHSAHPDRGSGWSQAARLRTGAAALVESGRHAGRPSVAVTGLERRALAWHSWSRDPFGTLLALSWRSMLATMASAYVASFLLWAGCWFWLSLTAPKCVLGFETATPTSAFVSAFLMSVEAQQTIGWGARAPRACIRSAALETTQVVYGQLLTAVCAGVVFARVSHPRRRARSVFVSEAACVARREVDDGRRGGGRGSISLPVLSFRVADTKQSRDGGPSVSAYLFRWLHGGDDDQGDSRAAAADGDPSASLPGSSPSPSSPSSSSSASNSLWRVDELKLTNGGKLPPLLLPVTVEHVIDEASPLRGLSLDDLLGSGAEVVVQVCGSSDRGEFVVTRSYLAGELHWGCAFAPCVKRAAVVSSAAAGSGSSRSASASRLGGVRQRRRGGAAANQVPLLPPSQHVVDLSRFHEVVPLPGVGPTGIGGPPRPPAVVAAEVLGVAGGRGGGGDVL